MGFKTILVPIEQHDLVSSTLQTALLLARKFDSYIEGFALRVEIPAVIAVGDVVPKPAQAYEPKVPMREPRLRSRLSIFLSRDEGELPTHRQSPRPRHLRRSEGP